MKFLYLVAAMSLTISVANATELRLTDAQIDPAFAVADSDKNGTVSLPEAMKFGITVHIFRAANPDQDGSLDKMEFGSAIIRQFVQANPDDDGTLDLKEADDAGVRNKRIFEQANPDKDGTLDLHEYLNALVIQTK